MNEEGKTQYDFSKMCPICKSPRAYRIISGELREWDLHDDNCAKSVDFNPTTYE